MKLAEWLAAVPEPVAKAGPGVRLLAGEPGSRERPLSYAELVARRRQQLESQLG